MIYIDTSALVKLIFRESESAELERWLDSRRDTPKVTSDLSTVELIRVCRRIDAEAEGDATQLLNGMDILPIDRQVVRQASILTPPGLRSLDAIQLASALSLRAALDAFVAYDTRLCGAAEASGLPVVRPV